jgi:hypothetical protein
MNEIVKKNAIKYGIIAGLVPILYTLIAYLVNIELFVNFFAGIGIWVLMIVILIIAVSATKKEMGGYVSFKDAFSTFILSYSFGALLSTIFSILIFVVVDPEVSAEITELTIEKSVEMMERFGTPEDQIDAQVEAMESQNSFDTIGILKSFALGIVIYAILGLIVAAIMKKNRPEFENEG